MKFPFLLIGMLVVWTALSVVGTRHESRKLFVQLQDMEAQRDSMNEDWGRYQLEQATWGTHSRIEEVAREKLEMELPKSENIELVNSK
ncbi:MAG: cell division protein FtsL [Gammaproteobacteria bacterium]